MPIFKFGVIFQGVNCSSYLPPRPVFLKAYIVKLSRQLELTPQVLVSYQRHNNGDLFAPTCNHYSEKDACKFFRLSKETKELHKRLQMIWRKDRVPGEYSRICSCHFVPGKSDNEPTIFHYNVGKRFEESKSKHKRKRKKSLEVCQRTERE